MSVVPRARRVSRSEQGEHHCEASTHSVVAVAEALPRTPSAGSRRSAQ